MILSQYDSVRFMGSLLQQTAWQQASNFIIFPGKIARSCRSPATIKIFRPPRMQLLLNEKAMEMTLHYITRSDFLCSYLQI